MNDNKTKKRKTTNSTDEDIEQLKKELKEEIKKEIYEEINDKKVCSKSFEEKAKETFDKIMDTEDDTKKHDKKDIETNKIIAILAYFGPLCLIPYFTSKESKFATYHAKQGLNLFIIEFAVGILSWFLSSIFEISKVCNVGNFDFVCDVYTPLWISIPISFVQCVLGLIALIGLIYACQGKAKELPLLGRVKIIK